MGFLMPKAPTIAPPPPPPPPAPVKPAEPVRLQESKLKERLSDPRRVGRQQTIKTGPRGVMSEDDTDTSRSLLKGKRRAKASD
jgi:hypothetical protein